MKTQIFGLALALVMVVAIGATALPAMADTEGSAEGSFNLGNAAPTVTAIALLDSTEVTVSSMDPTTEYIARISVSDTNTLNDIDFDVFAAIPFRDESGSRIYVSFHSVVENQYKNLPNASIRIDVSTGASADENFTTFSGSLPLNQTETRFNYVPLMDQESENYVFRAKVIANGIVYAVSSVRTVESFTSDRI
jgi:hypothetical protein